MIIDCISDLHGHYPKLEGGDLLVVAGDLTACDYREEHEDFREWIAEQNYKCKIFIAGNHDNYLRESWPYPSGVNFRTGTYLCDSGTEFEYELPSSTEWGSREGPLGTVPYEKKKLKIWGSPWTLRFEGMNPHCMAFTVETEEELAEKWALIPDDVDILVTHGPAWGNNDTNVYGERCGSKSLCRWVANHAFTLKLHVHGHIHEGYGVWDLRKLQDGFGEQRTPMFINASHINASYEPVNKPIRIEL